ncbi:MAG: 50S ribosomal protein L10 [Epsilonproteobacteria bacterium]|nr:50S ribosomal protein L10 [Campylobacterota bacterium]
MTREEKVKLVEELSEEFKEVGGIVVCGFEGMTVQEMEALRNEARDQGIKVRVIKNRLADIAFKNVGIEGLTLKNTNMFVWGDDIVALAKVVTKYAKTASDKFSIKNGYFEGKVVEPSVIEEYSKLASKEEFLGMLLSTWTAPLRNFLYVLNGVQREFVTALNEIKKQKEAA